MNEEEGENREEDTEKLLSDTKEDRDEKIRVEDGVASHNFRVGEVTIANELYETDSYGVVATLCVLFGFWMAPIAPLCACFRIIERRAPFLWLIILILLQMGGLLDMLADIYYVLMCRFDETAELQRYSLWILIASSIISMLTLTCLYRRSRRPKEINRSPIYFYCGGNSRSDHGESAGSCGPEGIFLVVFLFFFILLVMKVLVLVIRFMGLFWSLFSLLRHGRFTKSDNLAMQAIMLFLLVDFTTGAVPFGVIVLIEYIREEGLGQMFFIVKMSSFGLDILTGTYIIYFCVFDALQCLRGRTSHTVDV